MCLSNNIAFDDSTTALPIRIFVLLLPLNHVFSTPFLLLVLRRNKNAFDSQPHIGYRPRVAYPVSTGLSVCVRTSALPLLLYVCVHII